MSVLTQHSLASDDHLLGLFLNGQRANQSSYFFGRFPFRELSQTLLTGPDASVDDFQEELS